MKAKSILILAMLVAVMTIPLSAETKSRDASAGNNPIGVADSGQHDAVLTDALATPAAVPRGPKEQLQDCEAEMAAITHSFSATLAATTESVQRGQLKSEQGQKIGVEQYQMAQMQFELLAAWRAILEYDLDRVPVLVIEPTPASVEDNETLTVAPPFSSFKLNSLVAQYLRLSKSQDDAIQQVIMCERRDVEPLMSQLRTTREKLLAADPERTSEKHIKALADTQAGLLAKLIVANARMHSNIYKLLTREQQKKLDDFTRGGGSTRSR